MGRRSFVFPGIATVVLWSLGPCLAAVGAPPSLSQGSGTIRELAIHRAEEHIRRGLDLGSRNAVYSAQSQFTQALRAVAIALDIEAGTHERQSALDTGLQTLASVDRVKSDDPMAVAAMQKTLLKVEEQLAFCGGNLPVASMALYSLGRSQVAQAEESEEDRSVAGPKAMTLYQAALRVDPANYLAANELSVLLVRYGQLDDAERVLTQCVAIAPKAELWRNLAVVYGKMGNDGLSKQAQRRHDELAATLSKKGVRPSGSLAIRWTDPDEFARMAGPENLDSPAATSNKAKPPAVTTVATRPETKKGSWLTLPNWLSGKSSENPEDSKR